MSMFRVKLSFDKFLERAKKYRVPFKFYVREPEKITMFMQQPIGSASISFLIWSEIIGDDETLRKTAEELKREGFRQAASFEIPLP